MYQSAFQSIVVRPNNDPDETRFTIKKPITMKVKKVVVRSREWGMVPCMWRDECDKVVVICDHEVGCKPTIIVDLYDV